MPETLARQIETEICATPPPLKVRCAWLDEAIWPQYGGLSVANIPASVAGALDVPLAGALPPLDGRLWPGRVSAQRVVLILLDGLGYHLLQALCAEPETAADVDALVGDGMLVPLTSVFPSTTAVALTSLWTGASPAAHGLLGTRLLLREYGVLASTLSLAPVGGGSSGELTRWGLEPAAFIPVPGLAQRFAAVGVATHLVTMGYLVGSGLSQILHRGVDEKHVHKVFTSEDMWTVLDELLETTRGRRCLIAVYWGGLDAVSHGTGAQSRRALAEARAMLRHLAALVSRRPADGTTVLCVTADHGHLDVHQPLSLTDYPRLAATLRMPCAGEARANMLFLRDGARREAEEYLHTVLGEQVMVLDAQEAIRAGLFGGEQVHPETPARAGDLLVVCRKGVALYDPLDRYRYPSQHGGLAAEEMLVPLIVRRL